jgi:hypothetical protein
MQVDIMARLTKVYINSVLIGHEYPVEFILDGTEEFNFGKLIITNSTQRTPYPDYEDVEVEINTVNTYEAIIQQDFVTRIAPDIYKHEITLAEVVIKLSQYIMADRYYTTIDGAVITYEDQLNNILLTHNFGKTSPFTIHADTQTLLDVTATEKEYSGGDLLTTLTDMFRAVNAIPTLSLNNVIGHELIGDGTGNLITISNIIGESITSDIADYGMAVHSKVTNATYEGGSIVDGGTYFPAKGYGITPRSSETKWQDADAEYLLDSGIRRVVSARIRNLDSQTLGVITAEVGVWIVPQEEWNDLTIERTRNTMIQSKHKNNTLYYAEGDNIIKNMGVGYQNNVVTPLTDTAMEGLIRSYWYSLYTTDAEYKSQNIKDYEIEFYYRAQRDMDVRTERHNIDRVVKNATLINNQKDSKLELQRYGNALKSQINRIGNDSYEVTLRYKEASPFTFHKINDYTSEGYKIVKAQFIARELSIDVIYKLVKNASILNPFTAVNRSISPFTVTKRNILSCFVYNEYFEISTVNRANSGLLTTLGRKSLLNALKWNATYDTPVYNSQFVSSSSGSNRLDMSATGIPLGQSMVFNAQFLEPKIAGYQLATDAIGQKLTPVAYTDSYGQVGTFTMKWFNSLVATANTHPIGAFNANVLIDSKTYSVNLNPNEKLGLSFHSHCITNNSNIIIGDYFVENNSLIRQLGVQQGVSLKRYAGTVKYNVYDKYAKSGSTGTGSFIVATDYASIAISSVSAGETWVICETASPNRLYLAVNYDGTDYTTLYFNDLEDRPNTETL